VVGLSAEHDQVAELHIDASSVRGAPGAPTRTLRRVGVGYDICAPSPPPPPDAGFGCSTRERAPPAASRRTRGSGPDPDATGERYSG
jgi:hypothetical protein